MPLHQPLSVLVPSVLFNIERLLEDLSPTASVLIGCRWSFYACHADIDLAEFDLPEPWSSYAARISKFGGVRVESHIGEERDGLDCITLGQPIVAAVDSFELPYRPAYGRVHSARTIIVDEIDETAGVAKIIDAWLPGFQGSINLEVLDRARNSIVKRDDEREPLFSGTPLEARWWAVSFDNPHGFNTADAIETSIADLAREAATTMSVLAIERFGQRAVSALTSQLPDAFGRRRAAALLLRAELGLRAYLLRFLEAAAVAISDSLFTAEMRLWRAHISDLALVRDILIKSTRFDRPDYAHFVSEAITRVVRAEHRFVTFALERFAASGQDLPAVTTGQI